MKKEPIWIVENCYEDSFLVEAVGNCDEIAIYLYSKRLDWPHTRFVLTKWENIHNCTRIIQGKDHQNWDRFLDAFEAEECTEEHETAHMKEGLSTDTGFFGWNKN